MPYLAQADAGVRAIELAGIGGGETGEGTIGGVFATNMSARGASASARHATIFWCPRRERARGCFQVRWPRDEERHGLDLCRGPAGSWGTLAVMCEVTFKVQPMPEDTGT
jgi:glycolate oxidase FAD binding subunit